MDHEPRGEPIAIILLKEHAIKLHLYLSLRTQGAVFMGGSFLNQDHEEWLDNGTR